MPPPPPSHTPRRPRASTHSATFSISNIFRSSTSRLETRRSTSRTRPETSAHFTPATTPASLSASASTPQGDVRSTERGRGSDALSFGFGLGGDMPRSNRSLTTSTSRSDTNLPASEGPTGMEVGIESGESGTSTSGSFTEEYGALDPTSVPRTRPQGLQIHEPSFHDLIERLMHAISLAEKGSYKIPPKSMIGRGKAGKRIRRLVRTFVLGLERATLRFLEEADEDMRMSQKEVDKERGRERVKGNEHQEKERHEENERMTRLEDARYRVPKLEKMLPLFAFLTCAGVRKDGVESSSSSFPTLPHTTSPSRHTQCATPNTSAYSKLVSAPSAAALGPITPPKDKQLCILGLWAIAAYVRYMDTISPPFPSSGPEGGRQQRQAPPPRTASQTPLTRTSRTSSVQQRDLEVSKEGTEGEKSLGSRSASVSTPRSATPSQISTPTPLSPSEPHTTATENIPTIIHFVHADDNFRFHSLSTLDRMTLFDLVRHVPFDHDFEVEIGVDLKEESATIGIPLATEGGVGSVSVSLEDGDKKESEKKDGREKKKENIRRRELELDMFEARWAALGSLFVPGKICTSLSASIPASSSFDSVSAAPPVVDSTFYIHAQSDLSSSTSSIPTIHSLSTTHPPSTSLPNIQSQTPSPCRLPSPYIYGFEPYLMPYLTSWFSSCLDAHINRHSASSTSLSPSSLPAIPKAGASCVKSTIEQREQERAAGMLRRLGKIISFVVEASWDGGALGTPSQDGKLHTQSEAVSEATDNTKIKGESTVMFVERFYAQWVETLARSTLWIYEAPEIPSDETSPAATTSGSTTYPPKQTARAAEEVAPQPHFSPPMMGIPSLPSRHASKSYTHRRHPSSSSISLGAFSLSPPLATSVTTPVQTPTTTRTHTYIHTQGHGRGQSPHQYHYTHDDSIASPAPGSSAPTPAPPPVTPPPTVALILANIYLAHISRNKYIFLTPSSPSSRFASVTEQTLRTLFIMSARMMGPLPRIAIRGPKSKSKVKDSPRKGKEREPDKAQTPTTAKTILSTPVSRRLENVLLRCCEGLHSNVALQFIERCAFPFPSSSSSFTEQFQDSHSSSLPDPLLTLGALRSLRLMLRAKLHSHLLASYVQNTIVDNATHSGAMIIDEDDLDLLKQRWNPDPEELDEGDDDENRRETKESDGYVDPGWPVGICRGWLAKAVESWVELMPESGGERASVSRDAIENILIEVLGILKDCLQEAYDAAHQGHVAGGDDQALRIEMEVNASLVVGETLGKAALYVKHVRGEDGAPYKLPLERPREASSPILQSLCDLLDPTQSSVSPFATTVSHLPRVALSIASHLHDQHTKVLPRDFELTPASSTWFSDFQSLFAHLCVPDRPLTREALFKRTAEVWEILRDWPAYRRSLGKLVYEEWRRCMEDENDDGNGLLAVRSSVWKMIGHELAVRICGDSEESLDKRDELECVKEDDFKLANSMLEFIVKTASTCVCWMEEDSILTGANTTPSVSSPPPASAATSPVLSRMHSQHNVPPPPPHTKQEKRESITTAVPNLVSHILGGRTSTAESAEQTPSETPMKSKSLPHPDPQTVSPSHPEGPAIPCQGVASAVAAINAFSQLALCPNPRAKEAEQLFEVLLDILKTSTCSKTRLAILQYMMRLRSDRDHRVFLLGSIDNDIEVLAESLDYTKTDATDAQLTNNIGGHRARSMAQGRSRPASRGRGTAHTSSSRSRSRAPMVPSTPTSKSRSPIWSVPEAIPFYVPDRDEEDDILFVLPSSVILTYQRPDLDPRELEPRTLMVSEYVSTLVGIIENEKDWDILAYVLTHFPIQLANRHFFCGPRTRKAILKLHEALCRGLADEKLGTSVDHIPLHLKPRDMQSVGYHVLTVLISYRAMFEPNHKDFLIKVFMHGLLAGIPGTLICCLSALSLCAYELDVQLTRHLPVILDRLEMIMSNAAIAVHVLAFLRTVGSRPSLYANFTDEHFKTIFSIALKYLETHNDPDANSNLSFALTQHVLVMTFNVIYTWFLAVDLEDRPKHVGYITRRVLLANNNVLTEPAEVCFDWLARYTYASVDPKPAPSILRDAVMHSPLSQESPMSKPTGEKWWLMGAAVIMVRTHTKRGWLEVEARRTSGMTRFLCRVENFPHVPIGDVEPDLVTLSAAAMMNRVPARMAKPPSLLPTTSTSSQEDMAEKEALDVIVTGEGRESAVERPDSTTGYVWTGTAPSQRRKEVSMSPAFFGLQLSPYPSDLMPARSTNITDLKGLQMTIKNLDLVPVIDTHTVGVLYVAPGQMQASHILMNEHGSPAYTRFLQKLGRLLRIRDQLDVYTGGLNPDRDGEYAIAWWDDIGQLLYHVTTMMPSTLPDEQDAIENKKSHVGNDFVKIVWNDSGLPYDFHTIPGQYNYVNIIIEAHSTGTISAYSDDDHENEYLKVYLQRKEGMPDFGPVGEFKIISAINLPLLVRRVCLLADWFCKVYQKTGDDTVREEFVTNWRYRLQRIKQLRDRASSLTLEAQSEEISFDFTTMY